MKPFLIILVLVTVIGCTKDKMPLLIELDMELRRNVVATSPDGTTDFYILPDEADLANIPQDPLNPLTPSKVELGKFFFFETGLAMGALKEESLGTYSCSTCHVAEAGFRPGSAQGIADGGFGYGINGEDRGKLPSYDETEIDVQSARPLNLLNVAYVTNTFWNGRFGGGGINKGTEDVWSQSEAVERNHLGYSGIETQNFEGVVSHRITINKEILDSLGYLPLYNEVFADVPVNERYTVETASLAFSAFIRTLISNKAPWQKWLKGQSSALSYKEKKGGILFFGKAQCYQCHYNQNLGSMEFHALGVKDMYQRPSHNTSPDDHRNLGRGGFTLKEEDNYKFKVPGIYNISDAPFYFHGSSKTTLSELIDYKNIAVSENPNVSDDILSHKFNPIYLTDEEKAHLELFLKESLQDPELIRYKPDHILSGNCFPNNDLESQIDLGCS